MSVKKWNQFKNRGILNENVAKTVVLLQSWPDECLALFRMQQSPTKSIFTLPEIRDQFFTFIQSFPATDATLIDEINSKFESKSMKRHF